MDSGSIRAQIISTLTRRIHLLAGDSVQYRCERLFGLVEVNSNTASDSGYEGMATVGNDLDRVAESVGRLDVAVNAVTERGGY